MSQTTALERLPQAELEKFRLAFNTKAEPIGLEKGKQITQDLALGLPEFNVHQYFGTQPTIFVDYDFVATAYTESSGRAIGLLGARWLGGDDVRFLYLWTAMIADAYRNTALFNRMLKGFFLNVTAGGPESLPDLIVTKTYNPIVYCIFKSFAQAVPGLDIYPQIPAPEQSAPMRELAARVARAISAKLDLEPTTGVVRGGQAMVAPDFFPRMEASNDLAVNAHFQQHLTRADQVLCILKIDHHHKGEALASVHQGRPGAAARTDSIGGQS